MGETFKARVDVVLHRARVDSVLRRGSTGLFYGLLPGFAAAVIAGSIRLPFPALWVAVIGAAAGAAAGIAAGLFAAIDAHTVLLRGDRLLATRELASTALELSESQARSGFAATVIEDAAAFLARTASRKVLGRLRLPLAPFIPVVVALTAAALLFPLDLRPLFSRPGGLDRAMTDIGEDLKEQGQALNDAARELNLGRSLALSLELTQLGRELEAHKLTLDEALDRISDLESRLGQEYQLALRNGDATVPPSGAGNAGDSAGQEGAAPGAQSAPSDGSSPSAEAGTAGSADRNQSSLGDALDKLRQDKWQLSGRQGPMTGRSAQRPPESAGTPGKGTGGSGNAGRVQSEGQKGDSQGDSLSDSSADGQDQPGKSDGSQAGNAPALQKTGEPTAIARGSKGPGLQAKGATGEGDMARLLARSLPDATGSELPDATVLDRYARQAESALAHDEVPQDLREYVKGYFTNIGISTMGK